MQQMCFAQSEKQEEDVMHIHGGDIYTTPYRLDFSANVNPLGMPKGIADAACRGVLHCADYPDTQCRELRRALAQKEGVPEEYLVFGNGAADLIYALSDAVRPERALLAAPDFAEYEQAISDAADIRFYPLLREKGFQVGEDYLDYLDSGLQMAFFCNPNNPTGAQTPRPLLEKIIETCENCGIFLVLDVCFMDFLDRPEESDFHAMLADHPHLILLKAFTKTYAMAGLRLGYALTANAGLRDRLRGRRQPWSISIPAQMAGLAALKETVYVEKARKLIRQERPWLAGELQKLGLAVYPGAANYLFFQGPEDLARECAKRGILIRDCRNYRNLRAGDFRAAVRTHEENEELVRVLKECVAWQK